jgi:hypothetical protein
MICDGEGCLNKATLWFYLASQDEPAKIATLYDMCPKCAATVLFKAQAKLRGQLTEKWVPLNKAKKKDFRFGRKARKCS